ncbi:unnamed protein product [Schistocephalus solidus]|uniref:Uncharacterized protein n=1 Tax=Schistocephalus solidus TaxID=70667 RepID=A0A3P7EMM0_SCHSO|nr:unnamed protein product [Schistocephalus solidus]
MTIDLTESDEESKVSGKRRPSDKLFPEAIRPRSVGKPPTEPTTGSQRPSSLNSSYPAASTSAFSNMSTFAAGTSSSSSLCSTTSLFCMATTPTTSTCVQSGQKSSDRTDAQPYPYRHQHSYSPSRQLNQQQHHHCESACRGSPNHRGISTTAAAVAVPAVIPSGASAPFASAMLACATEQFYSAMLTNSAAAARSSSQGGGALPAVSTAMATNGSALHSVPSTAALRSRGQQPSVPQSPSRQLGSFNSPVDYPSHLPRSLSLNEAHASPQSAQKQRTLHDPAFKWGVPSPPSAQGTLTFPPAHLRPNSCSPQDANQALQEAFRRQHLSSPGRSSLLPHTAHYSPTNSSEPAHTSTPGPFMDATACVNRLRPTLRSQVTAASVAAAAAAAATLSSMQSAYHLPHNQANSSLSPSVAPLSSMSCLMDAQHSAALLAASSPTVARAAQAWLAKSMFGMAAAAAAAAAASSSDGLYPSHFGRPPTSSLLMKPPSEQPGGGAMDPRPGWPYWRDTVKKTGGGGKCSWLTRPGSRLSVPPHLARIPQSGSAIKGILRRSHYSLTLSPPVSHCTQNTDWADHAVRVFPSVGNLPSLGLERTVIVSSASDFNSEEHALSRRPHSLPHPHKQRTVRADQLSDAGVGAAAADLIYAYYVRDLVIKHKHQELAQQRVERLTSHMREISTGDIKKESSQPNFQSTSQSLDTTHI